MSIGGSPVTGDLFDRSSMDLFIGVDAQGVNHVATQSANFDITAGITQNDVPRNVRVVFAGDWDGGVIRITGTTPQGFRASEDIVGEGNGTVQGNTPFSLVSRIQNLGDRTSGNVTVQTGEKIGLKFKDATPFKTTVDGVHEDSGTINVGLGTFIPTTDPDGARDFQVWYMYDAPES